jgi:hypothetical protein
MIGRLDAPGAKLEPVIPGLLSNRSPRLLPVLRRNSSFVTTVTVENWSVTTGSVPCQPDHVTSGGVGGGAGAAGAAGARVAVGAGRATRGRAGRRIGVGAVTSTVGNSSGVCGRATSPRANSETIAELPRSSARLERMNIGIPNIVAPPNLVGRSEAGGYGNADTAPRSGAMPKTKTVDVRR